DISYELLVSLFIFLLIITPAYSQAITGAVASAYGIIETKSLDIYFGYVDNSTANIWYNKTLNFNPIDRVSMVRSASIRIVADKPSPPTNYYVRVNNSLCENSHIYTAMGEVQYVLDFECDNLINESSVYEISFMSDKGLGNVHYRLFITYDNNPDFVKAKVGELLLEKDLTLISNHDFCVGNNTLMRSLLYNYTVNNETHTVSKNETIWCEYGCDFERNECIMHPAYRILMIIGIIVFIIILILWFRRFI
ncbi:MAG: hypothetical protein ACE5J3_04265, partial [Methanosarcinales archaeon]